MAISLRRILCVVGMSATALVPRAGAQSVPALSFDVTGGAGAHTFETSHVYYSQNDLPLTRLGATIRLGTPGAIRPILVLDYATSCAFALVPAGACDDSELCTIAPDGSCERQMDAPEGVAVAAGVAGAWRRTLATITMGEANYAHRAQLLDANVGVDIVPHVMVMADARYIVSHDMWGDRTWFFPKSFGLRLH